MTSSVLRVMNYRVRLRIRAWGRRSIIIIVTIRRIATRNVAMHE